MKKQFLAPFSRSRRVSLIPLGQEWGMGKPIRAGAHLGVCAAWGPTTAWIHRTPGFGCTGGERRAKGMERSSRVGGGALRRRKPRRRRPRWPEALPRPRRPSGSRRTHQRCRGPTTRGAHRRRRRRRDAWPSSWLHLEHEHGGAFFFFAENEMAVLEHVHLIKQLTILISFNKKKLL